MSASFDLLFGQHRKPAFNQIEPGTASRSEVQMKARALDQPAMDQRGFVSAVVVQNQVNLKRAGDLSIDGVKERTKLHGSMSTMQLTNNFTAFGVQRSEQGSGAVAGVARGTPLRFTGAPGEQRLGAVQSLNLSF